VINYKLQIDAIFTCNCRDVKAQKPARTDDLCDWNPDFGRGSCQTIARMKQDPEHLYPKVAKKTEFMYKTHLSASSLDDDDDGDNYDYDDDGGGGYVGTLPTGVRLYTISDINL
jgi:hypothetical protein